MKPWQEHEGRDYTDAEWRRLHELPEKEEAQERIAAYVSRALPRELARRGVDWPVTIDYFDTAIFASLKRGGLRLEQGVTSGTPGPMDWEREWPDGRQDPPWWYPCTKAQAQELARGLAQRLEQLWRQYRGADETGSLTETVWQDLEREGRFYAQPRPGARPMELRLEPGCRVETPPAVEWAVVSRLGGGTATIPEALRAGWAEEV